MLKHTNFLIFVFSLLWLSMPNAALNRADLEPQANYKWLGDSIITRYTTDEFDGSNTNWFIQQHNNGIIFLSNVNGLYSYDGANWRDHSLGNNDIGEVRQFKIHTDDKIYIGARSEFGYFESTQNGELKYTSLLSKLKPEQRQISDVNNVYIYEGRIFFITPEQIMAYTPGGSIEVWLPEIKFSRAWQAGNKLFFNDGSQLKYFEGEKISKISQFENKDIRSFGFVQSLGNNYLIGTFSQGIFLWENEKLTEWLSPKRKEASMGLYNSLHINDTIFAVSTIRNGVLFFNHQAELVYHLNTENGLPVNITLNMFLDDQQGLWLAQEGQLTRAQLPFALSIFTASRHTIAKIRSFVRIDNDLIISAVNGVMSIDETGSIQPIPNALSSTANILKFKQELIIAGAKQCQSLNPKTGENKAILVTALCRDILLSKKYPNTLFSITERAVTVVENKNGEWLQAIDLIETTNITSALVEDDKGYIWTANSDGGLLRFWFKKKWHAETITADSEEVVPLVLEGKLLLATNHGFFYWDYEQQKIGAKVTWFHQTFGDEADAPYMIYKDKKQKIWIASREQAGFLTIINNTPQNFTNYPITASGMSGLRTVFEDEGITWLGFDNGIVRYQDNSTASSSLVEAHISELQLKASQKPLSLDIFSAATNKVESSLKNDTLRVFFSLSSYLQDKKNQYRFRLNKKQWSQWSTENYADLGALSGDSYTLEMEAKDAQSKLYKSQPQRFTIIPPWYKSTWAYFIYFLLSLAVLFFTSNIITRIRTRALREQQRLLEQQVIERTATIQKQADELELLDKAKSRFFANVSHEFRTPLTLAIGPLQELIRNNRIENVDDKQHVKVALENSQQMLSLVGQILDINRLESGEMPLTICEIPLGETLLSIINRFQLVADNRNVNLKHQGLDSSQSIWFDEDHLNKIITNLLSNAMKFSPEFSTIFVNLKFEPNQNQIKIGIADEGPGIPFDEKDHLFERFFQGKNSSNNLQPGTGIGLSMVKELLDLHQGKIELTDNNPKGCHFEITLKTNNTHYQVQHFVDKVSVDSSQPTPLPEPVYNRDNNSQESENLATILVVDDNQDLRHFIRTSIQSNYNVIEASQGQEALEMVKIHQPDFIISDVMMPIMDGLEFTQKIKQNPETAHIPLLLLTAKSTKRETVEGLQHGADDYLSKPFDSSELIARIAAHLQQKRNISKAIYASFIAESGQVDSIINLDSFEYKFETVVTENLADAEFDIDAMADSLNMERSTLFRKVKKAYSCTPNQYLKSQRLNLSLQMLSKQSGTVSEIAYAVGFQSLNYFSRSFREEYKVPPSNYQSITLN